ncbi:TrbC/VirB2 family protein [Rickettsiella endosymbiont of Dermanyssus gallinae]|uniref:TrbC/VirB2 family protein n=1 Tax=Rickettsiella endosymbiont of Dermanyssus gallinae TaxID=2856608 RepID=UPI001C52E919|nr:TrbC/VirB2 family protein [Rickettsiella endosymbiont of Dermanyssus gallinae]
MTLRKGKKRRFQLIYLTMGLSLFFPSLSWAYGGETPVSQGLNWVIDFMYGGTGLAVATISIIAVGLLCVSHRIEWKYFIQTLIGIAVIFGASGIASTIHGLIF